MKMAAGMKIESRKWEENGMDLKDIVHKDCFIFTFTFLYLYIKLYYCRVCAFKGYCAIMVIIMGLEQC